ncbi:MAG: molybdate ABC transporter permease subunit [Chthoniobacteraceae bacterium]
MDWQAISLSLRLSTMTTGILILVGLPLAWWLASTRWRVKFLVEAVIALPLVLPPTVLGFYILVAIGTRSPLGQAYEAITGSRLPFSFQGLLLASVLYSMPFAVQPFAAALSTVDRRLMEASYCLGVGRLATFFRVTLPMAWPGILSGIVLSFAHTVGEFGVVLMIGGNLRGITRTISVSIYDQVEALDYAAATQTSLLMLIFSFIVLAITYALQRKPVQVWMTR